MILPCVLLVVAVTINGENDKYCKFKNGKLGNCVKIQDCPLTASGDICGFYGNAVAVCCSQETPIDEESVPLSRITRTIGDISQSRCEDMVQRNTTKGRRVTNGVLVKLKEYRHMAVLGYGDDESPQWSCGGALISDKHVLTAAHCLKRQKPSVVRLGVVDLSTLDKDAIPQDFKVKNVYIFDGFNPPAKYHDIAIIELDGRVKRSPYIDVACLDTTGRRNERSYLIMGWGKTEFSGPPSEALRKARVLPFETRICNAKYGSRKEFSSGILEEYMICAGGESDTCQGDSGGPLIVKNDVLSTHFHGPVYDIIGVTSFGRACGLTSDPGIYTRVQYYLPWIERIVWPESYSHDSKLIFLD